MRVVSTACVSWTLLGTVWYTVHCNNVWVVQCLVAGLLLLVLEWTTACSGTGPLFLWVVGTADTGSTVGTII